MINNRPHFKSNSKLLFTFVYLKELKSSELFKKVKQGGWFVISQEGSHIKMKHPAKEGTLIFPYHGAKEVAKGMEKAINKQAGL